MFHPTDLPQLMVHVDFTQRGGGVVRKRGRRFSANSSTPSLLTELVKPLKPIKVRQ